MVIKLIKLNNTRIHNINWAYQNVQSRNLSNLLSIFNANYQYFNLVCKIKLHRVSLFNKESQYYSINSSCIDFVEL